MSPESLNRSIDNPPRGAENRCVAIRRHNSDPDRGEIEVAGAKAVREIDQRTAQEAQGLLSAVLCAAWPSLQAQNQ